MPEFYIIIARKIFFPCFWEGGGARVPCPTRLLRLCIDVVYRLQGRLRPLSTTLNAYYFFEGGGRYLNFRGQYLNDDRIILCCSRFLNLIKHIFALGPYSLSLSFFQLKIFLTRYTRSIALYPSIRNPACNATLPTLVTFYIFGFVVINSQLPNALKLV